MKIINPYKFISRILVLLLLIGAVYVYMPREEAIVTLPEPMSTATITIATGDTLWTLAEKMSPENPRELIYTIKQINGLRDDLIYPGQRLQVPVDNLNLTAHE